MKLHLFNGAKTKTAWDSDSPDFIDNWKPEEKTIKCDLVQVTYGEHLRVILKEEEILSIFWKDDLIEHEGVFYGDFIVTQDKGVFNGDFIVKQGKKKKKKKKKK